MSNWSQGSSILTNRYDNKGTAFTPEERSLLHIRGRLPPKVETIEQQVRRCYVQFSQFEKPINKYQFLATLHTTNTTLYYSFILSHIDEVLPIIYTPTVGEACMKFGSMFFRERGLYFHKAHRGSFKEIMEECCYKEVDLIVITDGSRILGLGDLGANGMGISIGKCSLYVVGGGVKPKTVIPVMLDVGTNNDALRESDTYLGTTDKRLPDDEFYGMLDEFMEGVKSVWPSAVIQFEDFSNNHCFDMLDRYQSKYRCFNDDIQGTGAVVSAGFLNALTQTGVAPLAHKTLVFGAGSAAVGVALSIADLMEKVHGVPREEVLKTFYLFDTKGLVTNSRGDKLAHHKIVLARTDIPEADNAKLKELMDVMRYVKPTALLGLGGVGPVFTEELCRYMASYCDRPIIFPLSNPSSKAEVIPANAYAWTDGRAIVASGSPFPGTVVNGVQCTPAQGNNMYIFPGLGLGCSVAQPSTIPNSVVVAASAKLYHMLSDEERAKNMLYPPLKEIREISKHIAVVAIRESQRLGLVPESLNLPTDEQALLKIVTARMWNATYSTADAPQLA